MKGNPPGGGREGKKATAWSRHAVARTQWHSVKGGVVRCERSPRKLQWDILIAVKNKGLGDGMETTLEIWPSVWKNGDISMPHKVGEKKMGKRKELILDNLLLRC